MLRMKDVALRAGVSVATVSNVITGKKPVSDAVREKVLRAIDELNYQVNLVARGLKTQRTHTIGVVLPDVTKLFFMDVIRGIMDEAYKNGYNINILSSGYIFATERKLVNAIKSTRADGIILGSCVPMEGSTAWVEELVRDESMPTVVSIESRLAPNLISSVLVENETYSGRITQHLIDSGRRRIFFISGPLYLEHEFARMQGYRNTLLKNGLSLSSDLEAGGDYLSGTSYDTVCRALREGAVFDAIQASNDQAAIGAIKALRESGITVPDQVAVAGFDNLFASTLVDPAVTTVNVPRYDMGCTAVRELLRRIGDKNSRPHCHILPASVIIRSSTSPNATDEWNLENW